MHKGTILSTLEDVQCIYGLLSLHCRLCSAWRDLMTHVGTAYIVSAFGDVQCTGGYQECI